MDESSSELGEPKLNPRRLKTSDELIDAVDRKVKDPNLKEKTINTLDEVNTQLIALFKGGGVIITSGKVLSKDLSEKALTRSRLQEYADDRFTTTTSAYLRDHSDLDIESLGLVGNEKVYYLNEGFEENLGWEALHNQAIRLFVKRLNGNNVDLEGLIGACGNLLVGLCQQKGIPIKEIITPAAAIRVLMRELSNLYGLGRLNPNANLHITKPRSK